MNKQQDAMENRRNYLRINDTVSMKINSLEEKEIADIDGYFAEQRIKFSLRNHLSYDRAQHLPQMRVIEQRYPEMAQYLKFLENQIETISTSMIDREHALAYSADTEVSLSAQGMGFMSKECYAAGSILGIVLKLFPSKMTLLVFAEVIRSVDYNDQDSGWWTGVHFTHIHEEDREMLIKHNYRKQMKQILDIT